MCTQDHMKTHWAASPGGWGHLWGWGWEEEGGKEGGIC